MRVLFIDDMSNRWEGFVSLMGYHEHRLVWVNSATSAKSMLKTDDKFDVIFFDHDLEERHYEGQVPDSDSDTGYSVAKFLVNDIPKDKHPKWGIIHSLNYAGSDRILGLLSDGGIAAYKMPFGSQQFITMVRGLGAKTK
jgi:CheY-like chemotaxis protein